jgi:hypothetical protein
MKKTILAAVAAGALAVGGAAGAQDLGSIISNIFGLGQSVYGNGPLVGSVPSGATIYADQYGRQFYYDQYGRPVFVEGGTQPIVGYDNQGRALYGGTVFPGQYGAQSGLVDRDGDGVADVHDRWPNDSRYR